MGSVQSQEESNTSSDLPKMIRIERSEIPEEYKTVQVSSDVVERFLNLESSKSDTPSDLKNQLAQERELNLKLREQISKLAEPSLPTQKDSAAESISIGELQARKDAFDETLERVEKQYFSYRPENACKVIEIDLMECIKQNKNKVLNCGSFASDLTKCASDFREKVLKEVPHL
uniref:Uncharacterized protein n=1 Tax=Setaria digitata TaxID=48799 RepID=A0A915PIB7_9BILA